jgi:hypothetical protein
VPLQHGANEIAVTARNEAGETTRTVALRFAGRGQLDRRGTLYIIAVGVDDYDHYPQAALRFAARDARGFRDHMACHSGPLHKAVEARLLVTGGDAEPTRDNIENALALFRKAKPEDTVALFLAGHGTEPTDDQIRFLDRFTGRPRQGDYLFLPQNARADGRHWLPTSVVPWPTFQRALHNAEGQRLMFVDTCHAHGAYDPRMVHLAGHEGIVMFSATDRGAPSFEDADLRHGAFTFALTQGLAGGRRTARRAMCGWGGCRITSPSRCGASPAAGRHPPSACPAWQISSSLGRCRRCGARPGRQRVQGGSPAGTDLRASSRDDSAVVLFHVACASVLQ